MNVWMEWWVGGRAGFHAHPQRLLSMKTHCWGKLFGFQASNISQWLLDWGHRISQWVCLVFFFSPSRANFTAGRARVSHWLSAMQRTEPGPEGCYTNLLLAIHPWGLLENWRLVINMELQKKHTKRDPWKDFIQTATSSDIPVKDMIRQACFQVGVTQ